MALANMGSILKTYAQEITTANQSLELTAKLVNNEYRWIGSNNTINPTLNITSGTDNEITTKSIPRDPTEHQLVIEGVAGKGLKTEELISRDEIKNDSSPTINFNSTDIYTGDYEYFDYYFEYHPETMLGKLQIN
jgi:hypothetical protein